MGESLVRAIDYTGWDGCSVCLKELIFGASGFDSGLSGLMLTKKIV